MAERKNITIGFYKIESALETVPADLGYKLEAMSEGEANHGNFDGRNSELTFRVHEPINQNSGKLYIVSIIKERVFLPVQFNRENGEIKEPELNPDSMGDISYYLIDTDRQAVLSIGKPTWCADFLRWLSGDPACGISPMFKDDALTTVNMWEIFRKVNVSIEAPAHDFVDNILGSELGENFKMLETLSGLKIDVSVSMGHGKGQLHKNAVRNFLKAVLEENFAGKLKVSGKSFEEQETEEIDLIAARLKHKTEIVIAGTHIAPDEAKATLYEAYQLHLDDIEAANEEE